MLNNCILQALDVYFWLDSGSVPVLIDSIEHLKFNQLKGNSAIAPSIILPLSWLLLQDTNA